MKNCIRCGQPAVGDRCTCGQAHTWRGIPTWKKAAILIPLGFATSLLVAAIAFAPKSETNQEKSQNQAMTANEDYRMCVARAGGVVALDIGANYKKACLKVTDASTACQRELENLATLHDQATYAAINSARDICEGKREVGPAYSPPKIAPVLEDDETEADAREEVDRHFKDETAAERQSRAAFTRANLQAINRCFEKGDWEACAAVQRAAEKTSVGSNAYEYQCVMLTVDVASRQAAYNQPGAIETIPANVGKPATEIFEIQPKQLGDLAYGCNMELRNSGLPLLSQ